MSGIRTLRELSLSSDYKTREDLDKFFVFDREPYDWLERHGFRPTYDKGGWLETYVFKIMMDFKQGPHRVGLFVLAPPSERPYFRGQPEDKWMARVSQTLMVTIDAVFSESSPKDDPRDCLLELMPEAERLMVSVRATIGNELPKLTDNPFGF